MAELIYTFEYAREVVKGKVPEVIFGFEKMSTLFRNYNYLNQMFLIFNQRASMGSTDALSIIYRDIILEIYLLVYSSSEKYNPTLAKYLSSEIVSMSRILESISIELNWGGTIKK